VAEVVEERAGDVKEGLRRGAEAERERELASGEGEGMDTKAEWEAGVEKVKQVGSGIIETKKDVEETVRSVESGAEEGLKQGYYSVRWRLHHSGFCWLMTFIYLDLGTRTKRLGV